MLIEIKHVKSQKPSRWQTAKIYVLQCDHCGLIFERRYCSSKLESPNRKHYHDRKCKHLAQENGNSLSVKIQNTCVEKYGVDNPWKSKEVQERIAQTFLKRYGVRNVIQNREILSKCMQNRRYASVSKHWKTGESLTCVGTYELAFVIWANKNQIDFDWQIPHQMPNGRVYVIDAFIKDGDFANTWIEIKGWLSGLGKEKWEWFHNDHKEDSQLWNKPVLLKLGII